MTRHLHKTAAKPVVALMGEFSAGKSTLANLLLEADKSPVRVTATQMPPIWYTYGFGAPIRVDLSGTPTTLSEEHLSSVQVDDTAYVLIRLQADVLQLMDIVDMPGISDPNLTPESWQRTIPFADAVIWCSHATQAWRQSEAATWRDLPDDLREHGLLLLTRFDKLLTEHDGQRVLARVRAETDGLFQGVFPISLLDAARAGDDREIWEKSGAEQFLQKLLEMVFELATSGSTSEPASEPVQYAAWSRSRGAAKPAARSGTGPAAHSVVVPKRVESKKSSERGTSQRLPRSVLTEKVL
ncbi:GTPase [Tropicimonas sp. IMCC6043]|uniref:GTPase n=1 Tax=Tropicimonas sp. IMCC6043 TaxID=2510645 RepID=UPI00101D72DE|nr:GTPase [Tropicimonas sp. IMCC6043]RYH11261.1 hypothetical protein EU800_05205 [Tropicimonas sp. IMCC6043]